MQRNRLSNLNKRFATDAQQEDRVVGWRMSRNMERRVVGKSDFVLGIAGVGTAVASAAFAFVMITSDIRNPTFGGSEYLLLFTRPLQPPQPADRQYASKRPNREIDFTATGTIAPAVQPKAAEGANIAQGLAAVQPALPPQTVSLPLKAYKVRSVRGGVAIINGPTGTFAVENGSLLPNGDVVFAIDRRDGKWVVVTSRGIIENE